MLSDVNWTIIINMNDLNFSYLIVCRGFIINKQNLHSLKKLLKGRFIIVPSKDKEMRFDTCHCKLHKNLILPLKCYDGSLIVLAARRLTSNEKCYALELTCVEYSRKKSSSLFFIKIWKKNQLMLLLLVHKHNFLEFHTNENNSFDDY